MSQDSSISIASDYGLDDRMTGVWSPAETKDFSSSLCVQTSFGAHPASYSMCIGGHFPGANVQMRRDTDHSPQSSAEVKNE
jgi:hypothetical protein